MEYTLEYFIAKFEAIPEDKWYEGSYSNPENASCKCAYGHCGETNYSRSEESVALDKITRSKENRYTAISNVNDGLNEFIKIGATPKQRVVNYLKSLRTV